MTDMHLNIGRESMKADGTKTKNKSLEMIDPSYMGSLKVWNQAPGPIFFSCVIRPFYIQISIFLHT